MLRGAEPGKPGGKRAKSRIRTPDNIVDHDAEAGGGVAIDHRRIDLLLDDKAQQNDRRYDAAIGNRNNGHEIQPHDPGGEHEADPQHHEDQRKDLFFLVKCNVLHASLSFFS
jgi:hypothetical protein